MRNSAHPKKIPAPGPIQAGAGRDFPALSSLTFPRCRVTSTSWRSDAEWLGALVGTEKFGNCGVFNFIIRNKNPRRSSTLRAGWGRVKLDQLLD
ncbi:hypothetical protein AMECASPLE_033409 [Ameca splendens]|uniref:Uncharacterized protein n=1 Tax=Ameca splendens TaxID=208324 RepID=A0ABV0ZFM7_9TELE